MQRLGGRLIIAISAAVFLIGVLTSCGMFAVRALQMGSTPQSRPSASSAETQADPTPLELGQPSLSAPNFNPAFDSLTASVSLSKPASVDAVIVSAASQRVVRSVVQVPADGQVSVRWDGKDDHGAIAAAGDYRIELHATDASGHQAQISSATFSLTNKYILVSEARQALYAYDGASLFLKTPVTTGGPELPTPTGTFHVLDKTQNLYVYSPWPQGSPYWFPDVNYQYALLFYETQQYGDYIHDASWRNNYGPGSNTVDGAPGQDDTGTHGCINVPLEAQQQLYPWAPVGTPVVVQP
jgi:lipoprotein-anchoring transpeptidase ErfK/SrfK